MQFLMNTVIGFPTQPGNLVPLQANEYLGTGIRFSIKQSSRVNQIFTKERKKKHESNKEIKYVQTCNLLELRIRGNVDLILRVLNSQVIQTRQIIL